MNNICSNLQYQLWCSLEAECFNRATYRSCKLTS
jgi:hypothetical protein